MDAAPNTLRSLEAWAVAHGVGDHLDAPIRTAIEELGLRVSAPDLLAQLVDELECESMRDLLVHPAADLFLSEACGPGTRIAFLRSLVAWLSALTTRPRTPQAPHAPVASAPARPAVAAAPVVSPELARVRHWAAELGVLKRLGDTSRVLTPRLQGPPLSFVLAEGVTFTLEDILSPAKVIVPRHWRGPPLAFTNGHRQVLVTTARAWLEDVSRAQDEAVKRRRDLDARARPPEEPVLRDLAQRLATTRDGILTMVRRRPLGTYVPLALRVAKDPLRIVYQEATGPTRDAASMECTIVVEQRELRVACTCGRVIGGRCDHLLAAVEAAIDAIHDPPSATRASLLEELAAPEWTRFFRAFETSLGRHGDVKPPDDERLVFRIEQRYGGALVEALVQKRTKRGVWSQGKRISATDLDRRRELWTHPRDARVVAALDDGYRSYGSEITERSFRMLLALEGHPRVFLHDRMDTPARVERARLKLTLEPSGDALAPVLSIGARRFDLDHHARASLDASLVISIDREIPAVHLCKLDGPARALCEALRKHPARFPAESHDELLKSLQPLQQSVDVALPASLEGEPVDPDVRPVVRISPPDEDEPGAGVEICVRPIPDGPAFPPGEGPAIVTHVASGHRVSARRSFEAERTAASAIAARLPLPQGERDPHEHDDRAPPSPWTLRIETEEGVLDLLTALRDLGDAVTVEWPENARRIAVASTLQRSALRIRVTERRDWFGVEGEVTVDGDEVPFATLLDAVRAGRRYVRIGPSRFAAIEDDLRKRVAAAADVLFEGRHGVEIGLPSASAIEDLVDEPGHLEAIVRFRDLMRRIDASRALDPALPAGLTAELRHYQVEGFQWLARLAAWGMGGCLADDMGLGKTVQALALLLDRAERGPALVVAPTSVGPNWIAEAARFAPGLRARLYRDAGRAAMLASLGPGDVIVTSYGLATRDAEALAGVRFATLILDEAQAIKNALTGRARAMRGLDAEFRLALTGTPVENHLGELWSLMRILAPGLFGSWDHFRDRFAAPIERTRDPERRAALARAVRPFLLRRTKAEVAPELPPRTELARVVDLSARERAIYDAARRDALAALAAGGAVGDARFAVLAALTRLRRLACHPRLADDASRVPSSKLAAFMEIVRDLRETGHRALVFSQFTSHLALVREALDAEGVTYAYLDGATPSEERTRRIDAFQAGSSDLFLISLKAGGTGLNLTAADFVIHLDPWWNPAVEDQATDRAHRIGQTRAVTVIRLIARGTIEESVLALHGDKRALSASIFDDEGGPTRLSAEDLASLIRAGADATTAEEDAAEALGEAIVPEDEAPPSPARDARPRRARPSRLTR